MSLTASTMLPLGSKAPSFTLTDTETGKAVSLSEFAGAPALLIIFLCNHCPFVKHLQHRLAALVREYQAKDVAVVGTLVAELTTELAEAQEAIRRADLAIPDFEKRQKAAKATLITQQRRENLAVLEAILPELEEAYRVTAEIQRRVHVAANREQTLASDSSVARVHDGYAMEPSLIPPLDYLGPDLSQQPARVRQFRQLLGKL